MVIEIVFLMIDIELIVSSIFEQYPFELSSLNFEKTLLRILLHLEVFHIQKLKKKKLFL
jgi:hypothetical protein